MAKKIVQPWEVPLAIPDFENAIDAGRFWNGQLLQVIDTMRKKLEAQKSMRPNADYRESDRNFLIIEQAQKALGLAVVDNIIILNKLKTLKPNEE